MFKIVSTVLGFVLLFVLFLVCTHAVKAKIERKKLEDTWYGDRPRYSKLTLDTLKKAKDSELEEIVNDFIFIHKVSKDMDNEYRVVKKLPKAMQWFYATWQLESEVNNGGFSQFFTNSSGDFVEEVVAGCRAFGAKEHEELVIEAVKLRTKQMQMEQDGKEFDEAQYDKLDKKFFKLNMSKLRIKYIKSHLEEFVCD